MSDTSLSPSSYIVLGLIAQRGPSTSYDLKRCADESVGYFWHFPRSQLYAEPQRLVGLGLLHEQQEAEGRRRRFFDLTGPGRAALRDWLRAPAGMPELRDLGLLKLFFIADEPEAALRSLAQEQLAVHRERMREYEQIQADMSGDALVPASLRTLRMGFLYEQANLAFWTEVLGGIHDADEAWAMPRGAH